MDRLSYRQKLWEMTDEEVGAEKERLKNWRTRDEEELFQEVATQQFNRRIRKEQKRRKEEASREEDRLILEYNLRAQRWLSQGVTRDGKGNYTYKGKTLLKGVNRYEIVAFSERLEQQRKADELLNLWKEEL